MAHVDAELDGVLDSNWKDASSIRSGNNNEDVQEVCRTGNVFISELCLQIKVSIKLRSEFGGCRIRIISVKELFNLKYLISGMGGLHSYTQRIVGRRSFWTVSKAISRPCPCCHSGY